MINDNNGLRMYTTRVIKNDELEVLRRENDWMRKCLEDEVRDGTNRMMRSRRDGFLTGMLFGFGFGLIFGYAIFLLGQTYGM